MFAKPFKLKSNNALKNSEKKHLVQRIHESFPNASEDKIKDLVPAKSNAVYMKLILNNGDQVGVFAIDNVPVMMEVGEALVPTVCGLWKVPELLPTVTIHSLVLGKVQSGAPLYLPGVVIPPASSGSFPIFQRNAFICACTDDNSAAAIVGRCLMSSGQMLMNNSGVCLETFHVYGDLLCKEPKFIKIERPKLGIPAQALHEAAENLINDVHKLNIQQPIVKEEWPALGKPIMSPPLEVPKQPVPNEPKVIPAEPENVEIEVDHSIDKSEESPDSSVPLDMDGLLKWCLLSFIKLEGKSIELPLLTNLLYKNHLIPICPSDRTLDVKKSSYKKLGKFLEEMQKEGLVEVQEVERGVSAVHALHPAHPLVRRHAPPSRARPSPHPAPPLVGREEYVPPTINEVWCVTAAVNDLFSNVKKGTPLTSSEVRSTLTEYIKSRNLVSTQKKGTLVLDSLLAKIMGKPEGEVVNWEEAMLSVQARMTAGTELVFADGNKKLLKSRLDPVRMQVATRSGNKKVTLVSNLESFGFSVPELAHVCQLGVAASCGASSTPTGTLLTLQGDQTHFVAKLLIEKYGLPKKFVDGADKALKKKK